VFNATADTTIDQSTAATNLGTGTTNSLGKTGGGAVKEFIVFYNISPFIPSNASIAESILNISNNFGGTLESNDFITIYLVNQTFNETNVTYNNFKNSYFIRGWEEDLFFCHISTNCLKNLSNKHIDSWINGSIVENGLYFSATGVNPNRINDIITRDSGLQNQSHLHIKYRVSAINITPRNSISNELILVFNLTFNNIDYLITSGSKFLDGETTNNITIIAKDYITNISTDLAFNGTYNILMTPKLRIFANNSWNKKSLQSFNITVNGTQYLNQFSNLSFLVDFPVNSALNITVEKVGFTSNTTNTTNTGLNFTALLFPSPFPFLTNLLQISSGTINQSSYFTIRSDCTSSNTELNISHVKYGIFTPGNITQGNITGTTSANTTYDSNVTAREIGLYNFSRAYCIDTDNLVTSANLSFDFTTTSLGISNNATNASSPASGIQNDNIAYDIDCINTGSIFITQALISLKTPDGSAHTNYTGTLISGSETYRATVQAVQTGNYNYSAAYCISNATSNNVNGTLVNRLTSISIQQGQGIGGGGGGGGGGIIQPASGIRTIDLKSQQGTEDIKSEIGFAGKVIELLIDVYNNGAQDMNVQLQCINDEPEDFCSTFNATKDFKVVPSATPFVAVIHIAIPETAKFGDVFKFQIKGVNTINGQSDTMSVSIVTFPKLGVIGKSIVNVFIGRSTINFGFLSDKIDKAIPIPNIVFFVIPFGTLAVIVYRNKGIFKSFLSKFFAIAGTSVLSLFFSIFLVGVLA